MEATNLASAWSPDALGYPWPAQQNRATAQAEREAERWVTAHGLLEDDAVAARFHGVSVGMLAGLTHPHAEPELLDLVTQLMAWIFIEDDRYDLAHEPGRSARLATRFRGWLDVLERRHAPASADAATQSLAELAQRLAARGSARWYACFVETMRRFWIEGVLVESWYRDHGITPDPGSYMATRVQTVGVYVCLALVELDGGELSDAQRDDPIVARMSWLTSRVIAYVNDIFSYEKERLAGDPNNFVHALRHHEGLDLPTAVARAVLAHDRELEQFQRFDEVLWCGSLVC